MIHVARCHRRLANPKEAHGRLDELLTRDLTTEQHSDVLVELGQMAIDAKDLSEATELLTQALDINPDHHLAHSSLATIFLRIGDTDRAAEHRERAETIRKRFARLTEIIHQLASVPGDADLRWEAGRILMEQGLNREGAAWMATALTFDPQHSRTHQSLADYYAGIGDDASADHHQKKATDHSQHDNTSSNNGAKK